jgi:hypothetical protein
LTDACNVQVAKKMAAHKDPVAKPAVKVAKKVEKPKEVKKAKKVRVERLPTGMCAYLD